MATYITCGAGHILIGCSALPALPEALNSLKLGLRHLLAGRRDCAAATCTKHRETEWTVAKLDLLSELLRATRTYIGSLQMLALLIVADHEPESPQKANRQWLTGCQIGLLTRLVASYTDIKKSPDACIANLLRTMKQNSQRSLQCRMLLTIVTMQYLHVRPMCEKCSPMHVCNATFHEAHMWH